MYNLKVEKGDGNVLLHETDILRGDYLYHHITLDTASDLTFGNTLGASSIEVFKMSANAGEYFLVSPALAALSSGSSSTFTKTYSLDVGNYGVRFPYLSTPASTFYQSKDNKCPITSPYTDVRRIFHPCSATDIVPAFTSSITPITESGLFANALPEDGYPIFSLGSRAEKDIVNIRLDFPDLVAGMNPLTFQLSLLSSAGTPLSVQPAPMGTTITVSATDKFYETFWTVPVAGTYYVEVTTATDPTDGGALQWYYFTAWLPKTSTSILKAIDMLRGKTHIYRSVRLGS